MKPSSFIDCVSYNGVATGATGSVVGLYDLGSGVSSIKYNLIYPTGYHFSGAQIFGPAVPLVSVGPFQAQNYQFTGRNTYRVGHTVSGDFSLLLDIDYSGCARNTTGVAYVLFSTADAPTGSGTFYIGVDEANRLFLQSSGQSKTLGVELHENNLVYVGLGKQKYLSFGVFDLLNQKLIAENIVFSGEQNLINKLYIGGFLNNTNTAYTGYFGKIHNAIYSNKPLDVSGVHHCANCIFATGFSTGAIPVETVLVPSITGYLLSGINELIVTGITPITGTIGTFDGSTLNVIFPSGLTVSTQTQEIASVLTGSIPLQISGNRPITFHKDTGKLNGFLKYDVEVDFTMSSGDYVEIYTFPQYNPNVSLAVNGFEFPTSSQFVQIIGNGLVETNNVDYYVVRGQISGFVEDDILIHDLLTGSSLVSPLSGYWARDKVALSGGGFFPSSAQFSESNGNVVITGITGGRITYQHDIYYNGQKMRSGYHYFLKDDYSGFEGITVAVLSGNLIPPLLVEPLYHPTGGFPTGVLSVEESEISFIPNYHKFTKYAIDITGDTALIRDVTGFSEQVWVNGVRQRIVADYVKNFKCTLSSGIVDPPHIPFNFYNNETGYFNID